MSTCPVCTCTPYIYRIPPALGPIPIISCTQPTAICPPSIRTQLQCTTPEHASVPCIRTCMGEGNGDGEGDVEGEGKARLIRTAPHFSQ